MVTSWLGKHVMRHFTAIRATALVLMLLLLQTSSALALTILYPGSFDPFHQVHAQEVAEALKLHATAHLQILPIESAAYNSPLGIPQPPFFPYTFRLELIRDLYAKNPHVTVVDRLRHVSRDPLSLLTEIADGLSDPDRAILIGSDVLEKWRGKPELNVLLKKAKLIVSLDPLTAASNAQLMQDFAGESRIEFHGFVAASERSTDLVRGLFQSQSWALAKLPADIATRLTREPNLLKTLGLGYRKRLAQYLFALADLEIPSFMRKNLNRLTPSEQKLLEQSTTSLMPLLWALPSAASDTPDIQFQAKSGNDYLENKLKDEYPGLKVAHLQQVLRDGNFMTSHLVQGLLFGREYIWPSRSIWNFQGAEVFELNRGMEIRETPRGKALWVESQGVWKKVAQLSVIKKGTPLYHWNEAEYADSWEKQGSVSEDELFWRIHWGNGRSGGGLYVSTNSTDSKTYGPRGLAFIVPEDMVVALYNPSLSGKYFWQKSFNIWRAQSLGVSAIQSWIEPTWFNLIDAKSLSMALPIQHPRVRSAACSALFN